MTTFLGHFHPLLVHLPIGFLVLALIMKVYDWVTRNEKFSNVLPFVLLISFAASTMAAITGYALSLSGGYDKNLLENHQWAGIALSICTGILYFLITKNKIALLQKAFWGITALLLTLTGHLGGSLTHGDDYLSFGSAEYVKPEIKNIQEAIVYKDVIEPVFAAKCWSCHSAKKQKGELRLDGESWIQKGGENGKVILPHQAARSHLYERLKLESEDEEHMPPSGKPQLSKNEIKLIEWWIAEGADFDKKVKELKQNPEIKTILTNYTAQETKITGPDLPKAEIKAADPKKIAELQIAGISILTVAQNSNYLLVNLNGKKLNAKDWDRLQDINKHVVWLKAKGTTLNPENLKVISSFQNLTQLDLSKTNINDESLYNLLKLTQLSILNLSQTLITENGLLKLAGLKKLRKIFLFGSQVDIAKWPLIKTKFPNTLLDSGNYLVPTLLSDTTKMTKEDLISFTVKPKL